MLRLEMWITIKTLYERGKNKTQIAEILGISRKTVRRVLNKLEQGETEPKRKQVESILSQHDEYIRSKVAEELTAVRIFQDLVTEKEYTGSYETVKKYVGKIKQSSDVYMHNITNPAEEAQVDFGYAGLVADIDSKIKKSWVFCMELTYSNKSYYETVFRQDVRTFLSCHINAFRYFGGVPKTVKIDNIKSAILKASFYEPEYQKEYLRFANYYGFAPIPCRIYTPTDKASVETQVGYVKNNFFKGRKFVNISDCNLQLRWWLNNICNKRVHSVTKKIPDEVFEKEEKQLLLPLPSVDYSISVWSRRTVSNICHICYENNYYSVPYEYVHKEVIVEDTGKLVRVYYANNVVAVHTKLSGKGSFQTNNSHYPSYKISTTEYQQNYKVKMQHIGAYAGKYFEELVKHQPNWWSRAIKGIIALAKEYSIEQVDIACKRAMHFGVYSYRVIKSICEQGIKDIPAEETAYTGETVKSGEYQRPLEEYELYLK